MTPRALVLALGTALIIITNIVILAGVAHNRGGEPESRVTLSQRELGRPRNSYGNKENSGLSLTLQWRVFDPAAESSYFNYGGHGGSPAWLDEKRMAELGFDVDGAKGNGARRNKPIHQADRQVLVVLQLAGSAWEEAKERAREHLAHKEALRQASPGATELIEAEKRARDGLAQEENENSRLFAVDVGTDLAALRSKYPDRNRYMILNGKLRLYMISRDNRTVVTGYLDDLSARQIHVPHALRGVFEAMPDRVANPISKQPAFDAVVAIGQRLEPWIEAAINP